MEYYFAPLEGVGGAEYRRAHRRHFPGVDKYYMPFVSPTQEHRFTPREKRNISPEANEGVPAVPQLLTKNPVDFLWAAGELRAMGYGEVNLNLGCPSGTVTGKGKGSAMLKDVYHLRRFLDEVYCEAPLKVSVKTRIGFETPEEWEQLLPVFKDYPIHELIIHPRTRSQLYRGEPHRAAFGQALETLRCPVIYNGDLFTAESVREVTGMFPQAAGVMLGRGLLSNPALLRQLKGGAALSMEDLTHFHDYLFRAYEKTWHPLTAVGRMHVFLKYFAHSLNVPFKYVREALRANKMDAYQDAVGEMFAQAKLKEEPHYSQPE